MTSHLVRVPVTTVWTAPDAPRECDRALVADSPDVAGWCRSTDREARLGLHGRTLTQALLGEPADVVAEHGAWVQVVLPWQPSSLDRRGYPGWLPAAHLVALGGRHVSADHGVAVVRPQTATLRTTGGALEVSIGTVLPARGPEGSELAVTLPDGGLGWLDAADVLLRLAAYGVTPVEGAPLAAALQFRGLRYLWGGLSGWGVDCSGLVHLAHRVHGVALPRDASDQHQAVPPLGLEQVDLGDLLFFARPDAPADHVGLVTGAESDPSGLRMLHAPEGGELVEDAPLAPERHLTLVGAGRCR